MAGLEDYLDLTVGQARDQYRALVSRRPVPGKQVTFTPVETLLCLAASFVVNPRQFGGTNVHRAPQPVPELARLFSRSPSSVLEKMRNLSGSRPHGATWDTRASARLRDDPARFSRIYRVLLGAARAEGIGSDRLPDFLKLEDGGELVLLGQEELDLSVVDEVMRSVITRTAGGGDWTESETEQIVLGAVRVGQHVFARNVLANCGNRCVFCGFKPPSAPNGKRLLAAGHIKPWKDSSPSERLDPRNGLAACPAHDAAFDKGMITVKSGLRIHLASSLANAVQADALAMQFYGRPPIRETLLPPPMRCCRRASISTGIARRFSSADTTAERLSQAGRPGAERDLGHHPRASCFTVTSSTHAIA